MHVLFQIRPRLIIIISFLVDKSPALGISFNEDQYTPECEFIQRRSFFFSMFYYMSSLSNEQMATSYFPLFEKWSRVDFLAVYSSAPIMVAVRLSPLTHTWLIVSWILSWPRHIMLIGESWRETAFPRPLFFFLGYYYSRLTIQHVAFFSHNPANVWGCHISSSHLLPIADRGGKKWIYAFSKNIRAKWNASSFIQDLNSSCRCYFQWS